MTRLHFDDLTAITAPFGLLDDDTKQRLRAWPHGVEDFSHNGGWSACSAPAFFPNLTYRASPAPLVQDSVDWSQVGPDVNHIARDEDGEVWGYENEPICFDADWQSSESGRSVRYADRLFPSYRRGATHWRDSLISRPGVEG